MLPSLVCMWCGYGPMRCRHPHPEWWWWGRNDDGEAVRLVTYTDHAAKVGREYGIRLAVKRRLAR
jgi:hypothetical protein